VEKYRSEAVAEAVDLEEDTKSSNLEGLRA
jgi:hypothetical protein